MVLKFPQSCNVAISVCLAVLGFRFVRRLLPSGEQPANVVIEASDLQTAAGYNFLAIYIHNQIILYCGTLPS